ncbi:hypothetical protein SLA2020_379640 [Shorea laevis]
MGISAPQQLISAAISKPQQQVPTSTIESQPTPRSEGPEEKPLAQRQVGCPGNWWCFVLAFLLLVYYIVMKLYGLFTQTN